MYIKLAFYHDYGSNHHKPLSDLSPFAKNATLEHNQTRADEAKVTGGRKGSIVSRVNPRRAPGLNTLNLARSASAGYGSNHPQ